MCSSLASRPNFVKPYTGRLRSGSLRLFEKKSLRFNFADVEKRLIRRFSLGSISVTYRHLWHA